MPSRTLIAYFSKGGAAARYAQTIAETLAGQGIEIDLVDLRVSRKPDIARYDNVILGTGVRIGMVYRRARQFLKTPSLKNKRLAVFLASGIAIEDAEASAQKFLLPLFRKLSLKPVAYVALPGYVPGNQDDATLDPALAKTWASELFGLE